jgi:hypothetical protein
MDNFTLYVRVLCRSQAVAMETRNFHVPPEEETLVFDTVSSEARRCNIVVFRVMTPCTLVVEMLCSSKGNLLVSVFPLFRMMLISLPSLLASHDAVSFLRWGETESTWYVGH